LGLAIVKGLVGLLGLRIQLKSKLGRGSVFSVLIPKSQADDHALQPKPIKAPSEFGKIRVLAIDDDEFVRDAIRQILFEMGCECDVVANLNEAKASAEKQRPDMILSDYMLRENRSGIQAIKQLREAFGAGIPALVITGDTSPRVFHEAKEAGIELLHKPLLPDQLYATLTQAMGLKAKGR
jgi:CheY-like chemotaxis protein